MTKMTSAYASKLLRKLNEDKEFWNNKERSGYLYVAAIDEEPVIPDYDYSEVAKNIEEIDEKIVKIKHAINLANATNQISVGEQQMTADMILVKMAQLSGRKQMLDNMRKQSPQKRIDVRAYPARKAAPEYQYINYDLELIKAEYERIDTEIAQMQMALDKYNQIVEFDVEI